MIETQVEEFEGYRTLDPVWIAMQDGNQLAAKIWLPADALENPVPAIVEPLPYRRTDGTVDRDRINYPWFAHNGYAGVRVDIRGSGDSDGALEDEYLPLELADGVAVLDWVAAQDWCNGKTALYGISWGGFVGLQIAALRPESLVCVISMASTDDRFNDDIHFKQGALLTDNLLWASTMFAYQSRPPSPFVRPEDWRNLWLERLAMPPYTEIWHTHQARDAYWRHGSVLEDPNAIEVPVLEAAGWADCYVNQVFSLMENFPATVKSVLGPWGHVNPHMASPGPGMAWLEMCKSWLDQWCKGKAATQRDLPDLLAYIQNPVEPKTSLGYRDGHWVAVKDWPNDEAVQRVLFLTEDGLRPDKGSSGNSVELSDPVRTNASAGWFLTSGAGPGLPSNQSEDEKGSMHFDGWVSPEPMDFLGQPVLETEVISGQPLAQLVVRLSAVREDGTSRRLSWGVKNLCHQEDQGKPAPLAIGEPIPVTVPLDGMGERLGAGERLRVTLSTHYWPLIWPSPKPAKLRVNLDKTRLILPLLPGDAEAVELNAPPPNKSEPADLTMERPSSFTSAFEQRNGREILTITEDRGRKRYPSLKQTISHKNSRRFELTPGDPLSALIETVWEVEVSYEDGPTLRTTTTQTMRGSEEALHFYSKIDAYEDGAKVSEHDWNSSVTRDYV